MQSRLRSRERHSTWRIAGTLAVTCAVVLGAAACSHVSAGTSPTPIWSASTLITRTPPSFAEPENLVYDSVADVYLVSNMGGGGPARDDNGFISRVSPDGTILDARWIAGGVRGATLDAPKGLALCGDTLAVADIGAVHLFDRRTGAPLRTIALPGLVMNDVACARDGSLWITDTGPARTPTPVDTTHDVDALWRVAPSGQVAAVARGLALGRPDGLVLDGSDALVATFGANRIERIHADSRQGRTPVAVLPGGRVDGLRRLPNGDLVVTSWDAKAVWSVAPGKPPRTLLSGITSPAGVAIDTRRHRLAVTSMQGNALYLMPLP